MREMITGIHPIIALAPLAAAITDNTAQNSVIIDRLGFDSLTFLIATGILADADATFAVTMTHGDTNNLADGATVAAADIAGSLALAGFQFDDDGETRKVGYLGNKRYVRLTITPTANTGAAPLAVIALLGRPAQRPTPNPPV
jgi:hypothetical protein